MEDRQKNLKRRPRLALAGTAETVLVSSASPRRFGRTIISQREEEAKRRDQILARWSKRCARDSRAEESNAIKQEKGPTDFQRRARSTGGDAAAASIIFETDYSPEIDFANLLQGGRVSNAGIQNVDRAA